MASKKFRFLWWSFDDFLDWGRTWRWSKMEFLKKNVKRSKKLCTEKMTNLEVEVETPELMFPPPAILSCILKPIWWDFQGRGEMILTGAPILAWVPTDLWCSLWISKLKEEGRDEWWDIDKLELDEELVLVIGWLAMLDKALMGSIFPLLAAETGAE